MKIKYINTAGQITAVITSKINNKELAIISKSIMQKSPELDQVGYLQKDTFQMMGGELSINGLLAAAILVKGSSQINGLDFIVEQNQVSLTFPRSLIIKVDNKSKIVSLKGITYQVIPGLSTNEKVSNKNILCLKKLSLKSPASGLIYCQDNQIQPLIYVKATNSYIWERACGSGSLAYSLVTGNRVVVQPAGSTISFKITKDIITVTTTVKEI
jgi:hypothetical protein